MTARLVDRLDEARRRGFVGRRAELARFRAVLAGADDARVLFVHGPGGIGKTALLRQFAWLAGRAGRRTIWLDGRETPADASAVLAALPTVPPRERHAGHVAAHPPIKKPYADAARDPGEHAGWGEDLNRGRDGGEDVLLVVDAFEGLRTLERWLRDELIPSLPDRWIVALAGRDRPSAAWRADPGWRELLADLPLRNLDADEAGELLDRRGLAPGRRDAALAFTRGHPLALALVADLPVREGPSFAAEPEVLATLLKAFVDRVPSPAHRRALETCALVMTVTEALLAAVLDAGPGTDRPDAPPPDAAAVFDWLRGLSIVEHGPRGLVPHDLVREVLAAELGWRDPAGREEIRLRAADHLRERLRTAPPAVRQALLLDLVYLHRDRSVLGRFLPGPTGLDQGRFAVTPPASGDWATLRSWVVRHEGEASAALFDLWRERQPEAFRVVRNEDGDPAGFFTVLKLERVPPGGRRDDPAVLGAFTRLTGDAAPREDETAELVRFWMAADTHQALSPVQTFITLHMARAALSTPFLAATFLPFTDPDFWAEGCARLGYERLPEADFEVGGRVHGVYWHDWRRESPLAWLSGLIERETGESLPGAGVEPLGRTAFAEAVREALRGLGRADGLRGSPLLGSALAARPGTSPEAALREAIEDAAAELAASPRDLRAHRALHHTYLRPAPTQRDAAELLSLPTSTYRRHLAAGIDRLTDLLWRREQDLRATRTS
ncbi:AAA family ATPase [Actinomadura gamaensis]|uniref:AAA family ATPase n=1 Tax=Actinomadura gamaensis TaxID=1763541 RepID=A0ABV9UFX1_9ACTN